MDERSRRPGQMHAHTSGEHRLNERDGGCPANPESLSRDASWRSEVPRPSPRSRHRYSGRLRTTSARSSAGLPSRGRMSRAHGKKMYGKSSASDHHAVARCDHHARRERLPQGIARGHVLVPGHTGALSRSSRSCSSSYDHCSLQLTRTINNMTSQGQQWIDLRAVAGQKQEQHPGVFARGAVRCSCGML
jgi:hypothetical protein